MSVQVEFEKRSQCFQCGCTLRYSRRWSNDQWPQRDERPRSKSRKVSLSSSRDDPEAKPPPAARKSDVALHMSARLGSMEEAGHAKHLDVFRFTFDKVSADLQLPTPLSKRACILETKIKRKKKQVAKNIEDQATTKSRSSGRSPRQGAQCG